MSSPTNSNKTTEKLLNLKHMSDKFLKKELAKLKETYLQEVNKLQSKYREKITGSNDIRVRDHVKEKTAVNYGVTFGIGF